jgi:hypothetical protein
MVQCTKCQTVLFIDFAGNVVIGGEDELSTPEDSSEPDSVPDGDIVLNTTEYAEVAADATPASEIMPEFEDPPLGGQSYGLLDSPNEVVVEVADEAQIQQFNSPSEADYFSPEPVESPTEPMSQFETESTPAFEVQEPVVSQTSYQTGPIEYEIQIDEIDSSSLRNAVLDSLRDRRLGLVHDEVVASIDQGHLTIRGLNPVKASYIINTLKDLPLQLTWKAYAKEDLPNSP